MYQILSFIYAKFMSLSNYHRDINERYTFNTPSSTEFLVSIEIYQNITREPTDFTVRQLYSGPDHGSQQISQCVIYTVALTKGANIFYNVSAIQWP